MNNVADNERRLRFEIISAARRGEWARMMERAVVLRGEYPGPISDAFYDNASAIELAAAGRLDEAAGKFKAVFERLAETDDPLLQERAAAALRNYANVLVDLDRPEAAQAAYERVVDYLGGHPQTEARAIRAGAILGTGIAAQAQGRYDEAIARYNEVADTYQLSDAVEVQAEVANAMFNIATVFDKRQDLPRLKEQLSSVEKTFSLSSSLYARDVGKRAREWREALAA